MLSQTVAVVDAGSLKIDLLFVAGKPTQICHPPTLNRKGGCLELRIIMAFGL
jgi:hypothetical protein